MLKTSARTTMATEGAPDTCTPPYDSHRIPTESFGDILKCMPAPPTLRSEEDIHQKTVNYLRTTVHHHLKAFRESHRAGNLATSHVVLNKIESLHWRIEITHQPETVVPPVKQPHVIDRLLNRRRAPKLQLLPYSLLPHKKESLKSPQTQLQKLSCPVQPHKEEWPPLEMLLPSFLQTPQGLASSLLPPAKELPKFQLLSSSVRPFPNEPAFASVEHFLKRFEKVVSLPSLDSDTAWRELLQQCMPHDDDGWIQNELPLCASWDDARASFKHHYGSPQATERCSRIVFAMTMAADESVEDYADRFMQAVHHTGFSKNDLAIAHQFLSSMTKSMQTHVRLALSQEGDMNQDWTVDRITEVARLVAGDTHSGVRTACSSPGRLRSQRELSLIKE